jgi:hypothetical protein
MGLAGRGLRALEWGRWAKGPGVPRMATGEPDPQEMLPTGLGLGGGAMR